ncbi:hypothetical protein BH11ACT3_BH11ACT3_16090 [soil metagenome]
MSKLTRQLGRLRDTMELLSFVAQMLVSLAANVMGNHARTLGRRLAPISAGFHVRSLIASTLMIGFGVTVAVTGYGGTFAYLNAQAQYGGATAKAGNASILVSSNGGSATSFATIPDSTWSSMLPGDIITAQVNVSNPSAAKFAVTSRLEVTGYYEVRTATGTCAAAVFPTAALTTTAGVALATLTSGANVNVCVQVKLSTSAPSTLQPASPGAITAVPFKVIFDATQVL